MNNVPEVICSLSWTIGEANLGKDGCHEQILQLHHDEDVVPQKGNRKWWQEPLIEFDCSDYFHQLESDPALRKKDQKAEIGTFNHSWHIGNATFAKDFCEVLKGDLDRTVVPTRKVDGAGKLWLK